MGGMAKLARRVARRFSESATLTMKQTTVLRAKPAEKFSLIAVYPGCCDPTGRAPWTNSKHLSAVRKLELLVCLLAVRDLEVHVCPTLQSSRYHLISTS